MASRDPFPKILPWLVLAGFTCATAFFVVAIDDLDRATRRPQSVENAASAIKHLVVIVQENHSFDSYFGRYCQAPTGSNPTCESGRDCCETGPARDPGSGRAPVPLTDAENRLFDPNHSQACELLEIDGGRMDGFVKNKDPKCGNPHNFAYATAKSADVYWRLADEGALADRYFQPLAGASSSNDMYLARAQYVFTDNTVYPDSIGARCAGPTPRKTYQDATIGELLSEAGVSWAFYAEGYQDAVKAHKRGACMKPHPHCAAGVESYPCIYDPSDNPFEYYSSSLDNPSTERDFAELAKDLETGRLPSVSYVKGLGFRTEHPGSGVTMRDGMNFVASVVDAVTRSQFGANTLILVVPDESGGYFDHIPPPSSSADGHPYGARIPLIALGPFAKKGAISHVVMEHSSIVKFIEWNWLGETGQLEGRDAAVNNIGSMLDLEKTGVQVPSD